MSHTVTLLMLHHSLPSTLAVQIEDADDEGVGDLTPTLSLMLRSGVVVQAPVAMAHDGGGMYSVELGTEFHGSIVPGQWLRAVIEFVDGDGNDCEVTRSVLVVPG